MIRADGRCLSSLAALWLSFCSESEENQHLVCRFRGKICFLSQYRLKHTFINKSTRVLTLSKDERMWTSFTLSHDKFCVQSLDPQRWRELSVWAVLQPATRGRLMFFVMSSIFMNIDWMVQHKKNTTELHYGRCRLSIFDFMNLSDNKHLQLSLKVETSLVGVELYWTSWTGLGRFTVGGAGDTLQSGHDSVFPCWLH